MSLTVTQRPNQDEPWVAAKNPVIYKMTRKDYTWTLLITSAGNTAFRIATDVTADFVTGDIVWLQSDDGAYSASGTVVSSAFGTYTTVITDVPWIADNAAGYINTITQRESYYVGIDVYNNSSSVLISTINYYPNTKGELVIDISQILSSVMSADITSLVNDVIINDTNACIPFYIKYTEFWTGSANSATDDSGNACYSVYGARQIGSSSYYHASPDYLNTSCLTFFDTMKIAIGEYYCISYISQLGGQLDWLKKSWYDPSRTLLCITYQKSTNNTTVFAATSVDKSVYTYFSKLAYLDPITPDRNITNIGTISWLSNSLLLSTGDTSKSWCAPFFLAQNKTISFTYDFTLAGNSTTVTPKLYLFDSTGTVLSGSVNIFTGSNTNYTGTVTITNSGSGDAFFVGFDFANASGANKTLTLNSLKVVIPSTLDSLDIKGIRLSNSTTYSETSVLFSALRCNLIRCTKNALTLVWRNSLGGQSSFTFNFNQDYLFKYQEPFKNKFLIIYDNDLSFSQYLALNELFNLGQVYQTPLIELTASVNKTEARIGQQVYIIDSSGNKTGIIVILQENKTMTKRNRHNIVIPVELPEIFG